MRCFLSLVESSSILPRLIVATTRQSQLPPKILPLCRIRQGTVDSAVPPRFRNAAWWGPVLPPLPTVETNVNAWDLPSWTP